MLENVHGFASSVEGSEVRDLNPWVGCRLGGKKNYRPDGAAGKLEAEIWNFGTEHGT